MIFSADVQYNGTLQPSSHIICFSVLLVDQFSLCILLGPVIFQIVSTCAAAGRRLLYISRDRE